ncbi:MAG: 50S ribosomal protein L1 [Candidatus Saccharimonadales bacterium]
MPTKKEDDKPSKPKVVKEAVLKPELKKTTAKAGKRSAKSVAEEEIKLAKEERKQAPLSETDVKKPKPTPVLRRRTRLEMRAKSYKNVYALIDQAKKYSLEEAAQVIGKTNPVKFDATVELHVRLGVDPKQAEENVRDTVLLPAGSGRNLRVAAYVTTEDESVASAAGAELVGETSINKELEAGSFSFDILISTPSQMAKLGKYARVLGPRGLMPNPKSGTVTTDVTRAVKEAKSGKVEYRVDSGGNLHVPIGKVSFKPEQLLENLNAVISSIQSNKPLSIKGAYVLSMHLSTSMGPSLKLAL